MTFPPFPKIQGKPISRKEIVESLYDLRDDAARAQREKDPSFRRWPDLDLILQYIATEGFPPPEP